MLPYTFEKQGCGNFHPDQIGDGHGHGSEAKGKGNSRNFDSE